jgi:SAM-dependent methyltransferase
MGAMQRSVRIVEKHYDTFPFPTPKQIVQQLPGSFSLGVLNFLLLRRPEQWLPRNAKIWVAGCGTQQGALWALSNPDAEIIATDISQGALDAAANLAGQLGLRNLRFHRQDLAGSIFREQFDLVVCTGVVHHLPDPASGLARIRESLKPEGALLLMVYNKMHREPLAQFRSTLGLLCSEQEELSRRYELACHLLQEFATSERCSPPGRDAFRLLAEQPEDRSQVADALLHPLEVSYDVDELLALLESASFEHISWLYPPQWDLENYLDSPDLISRFGQLDRLDRWKVVYFIAGRAGPLFELLAERSSLPRREPYAREELLAMPMVCSQGMKIYSVQNGQIVGTDSRLAYELREGKLAGRERGVYGMRRKWSLPEEFDPVLQACDGKRTLGQVLDAFSGTIDRKTLFDTLIEFFPPELGLLAPSLP